MEYRLSFRGETVPVEVEPAGEGVLKISMADGSHEVSCSRISEHQLHLVIDGKALNAYVAGGSDKKWIVINGASFRIGDADAARFAGAGPTGAGAGAGAGAAPDLMTPLMPSVVMAVLVKEGDLVEKGQEMAVLSAMKMETTLRAPFRGKVIKVNASVGDKVMPGIILVDLARISEQPESGED